MTRAAIARYLGISRSTLYKHVHLIPEDENISDDELTTIVTHLKGENPNCGEKYVRGHLKAIGKNTTQEKVRKTLRAVDPVGTCYRRRMKTRRGTYFVPGPNYLW